MKRFTYNDMDFSVTPANDRWDIGYTRPGGETAWVGAGLFADLPENQVEAKARALVKAIFPVGIRIVGPDTAHPHRIGDLKIVGPDVTHPNFIYWNKDSSSFPK